ncbi:MAG: 16S rRNA (cytosine(1402)-N(4))-methyltransferase RsmH [Candidatus Dormibacteraeota bacterium]|nr:16S rRNA (cytosine(1402)-N(4))-methyltransferase RsmH [Candidatus Dormibacteraeota bacterium]
MNGHRPVLLQEAIELLQPRPGGVFIDATLGGGGHARALLERIQPGGRLLGIDRDPAAVARCVEALTGFDPPPMLVQGNFADLDHLAHEAGLERVDGVLFDLGLSSYQLDSPERGFSFRADAPLDMRMDPDSRVSAAELVNRMDQRELARVIATLGEERWAARIADFIVRRRPLSTTKDLAAAVENAIPRAAWPRDIHPATRTFQAIRMEVNDELGSLEGGLGAAIKIISPGGRMAAISFHSLEDRLVKVTIQAESKDCICPPQQPVCTCAHRALLRAVTRKAVRPSPNEILVNPRSRSARLRVAERLATSHSTSQ